MTFHLAGGCRGRLANPGARRRAQERHGRVKLGGNGCKHLVFSAWPRPEVPGAVEEWVTPWPPVRLGKLCISNLCQSSLSPSILESGCLLFLPSWSLCPSRSPSRCVLHGQPWVSETASWALPCLFSPASSLLSLFALLLLFPPLPSTHHPLPLPCSHPEPPPGLTFLEASSFTGPVLIPGCSTPKRSSLSSQGGGGGPGGLFIQRVEGLFHPRAGGLPCKESWSPPSPPAWTTLQPHIHCRRMWDSFQPGATQLALPP